MVNFIKILVVSILFISNLSYSGWFGNSKCDEIESLLYLVTKEKDNGLKSKDLLKELKLYFKNKEANGADFIKNEFRKGTVIGVFASMPYHQDYSLSNSKAKSATKWAINRQVEGCKEGVFDKQFNLVGVDSLDIDDLVLNAYSNGQRKQEIEYGDNNTAVITQWYENGQKKKSVNAKNKKEHGEVESWYKNGNKLFQASFKNGVQHGTTKIWYENGEQLVEEEYINGKVEGLQTFWYENGNTALVTKIKNGEIDYSPGYTRAWYKNGEKRLEANIDMNNVSESTIYAWHKNGEKKFEEDGGPHIYSWYESGGKESIVKQDIDDEDLPYDGKFIRWYDDNSFFGSSKVLLEVNFSKDKLSGEFTLYYDNGQIKYSGVAVDNKLKGKLKSWDYNGVPVNRDWSSVFKEIVKKTKGWDAKGSLKPVSLITGFEMEFDDTGEIVESAELIINKEREEWGGKVRKIMRLGGVTPKE